MAALSIFKKMLSLALAPSMAVITLRLGTLTVRGGEAVLAEVAIVAPEAVERLSFGDVYGRLMGALVGLKA